MGMQRKNSARTLLRYELLVFSLLIGMSWADELLGLPSRLLGGPHSPNLREAGLETTVILVVAIPAVVRTRQVIAGPRRWEGLLTTCAWCKKVDQSGHWIPVTEFFEKRLEIQTERGMCPDCSAAQSRFGL